MEQFLVDSVRYQKHRVYYLIVALIGFPIIAVGALIDLLV